jgi:hypothetical protein
MVPFRNSDQMPSVRRYAKGAAHLLHTFFKAP